jgi:hypothetical protein
MRKITCPLCGHMTDKVTVSQVEEITDLRGQNVRRMIKDGRFPSVRYKQPHQPGYGIKGLYLIPMDELEAVLESRRAG